MSKIPYRQEYIWKTLNKVYPPKETKRLGYKGQLMQIKKEQVPVGEV